MSFSPRRRPDQKARAPIRASSVNAGLDAYRRKIRVMPPLQMQAVAGQVVIWLAGNLLGLAVIKTGPGGLTGRDGTKPGEGDIIIQTLDGSGDLVDGATVPAKGLRAGGFAGGLYGFAAKVLGHWWVLVVDCS